MPEFRREPRPYKVIESNTTLSKLKNFLATNPGIFGYRIEEVRRAVRNAENYGKVNKLPQRAAEHLDDLYRQFK